MRLKIERKRGYGHGAQFRREDVPGFQTHVPVTIAPLNAARQLNAKRMLLPQFSSRDPYI